MLVIDNFAQVTAQIEAERGIKRDDLIDAIEQALASACRRNFTEETILEGEIDINTGEGRIFRIQHVVKEVEDEDTDILLADAKKVQKDIKVGEDLKTEVTPENFGRIAAQTAKQVIIQRIREAEKNVIFDEFSEKIGQLITGTIQRVEGKNYLIDLGRIEALLTPREQIQGERFDVKEKIRLYVDDVLKTPKGPKVMISRANPGLLKCLFEIEVPEIQDGIIEIKSISREAGKRSKVAVASNNPAVGAVGTCVGHMGGRIQAIIKEIGDEKIDILEWDAIPQKYIANSLKPAEIADVIITDELNKEAAVVVGKDQLSLAIGKAGVNVRLAVKLTGWKLDILSQEEYNAKADEIHNKGHVSIVDRIQQDAQKPKSEEEDIDLEKSSFKISQADVSEMLKDESTKSDEFLQAIATETMEGFETGDEDSEKAS